MATPQDLISSALRLIGVIDSGETPSTSESNDGLITLNQLVSNWSASGIPIPELTQQAVPLTGTGQYTLTPRPLLIRSAACIAGGISRELEPYTAEQWATLRDRSRSSLFAQVYFWDAGWPSGLVRLWPIPLAGGSLELWTLQPLDSFASLSTTISLPPGYEQALRFALASALAPEYGRPLPPEVGAGANEAKAAIANLNALVLGPPQGAGGSASVAPAA